jgi:RNA-directed DNA polymerase
VNRLQRRIAKAVQKKQWGKAKALMYLLTKSFFAKVLAVFRVTNNKGGNTAGVDGMLMIL